MTQKNRQKKSIKLYSGALLVQGFMSLILAFNNMLLANNLDVQNMSDFSTIAQAVTQYIKHLFVFYIYNLVVTKIS